MGNEPAHAWHAKAPEQVCVELGVEPGRGLSAAQAMQRFRRYGPNRVSHRAARGPMWRFAAQFRSPLIQVLMLAGLVTWLLGEYVDAAVVLGVVVINSVAGFVQEGRAEHAIAAVRLLMPDAAVVLRDSQRLQIEVEQVVPGDVVLLESGRRIPADIRLLHSRDLSVDESALTGESQAVPKWPSSCPQTTPLAERVGMAYSGTTVEGGAGRGVVVATGDDTELGQISGMVSQTHSVSTPLVRRLDNFSRQATGAIVAIAVAVFAFAVIGDRQTPADAFLAGVGVAVAAIPEGLPAVITIILAIAAGRMARQRAIVRRLPAVETLGSVSTICTDKTGTLTRNEMTVVNIYGPEQTLSVSGSGYEPEGGFATEDGESVDVQTVAWAREVIESAVLCSDASLRYNGQWSASGDPMEIALTVLSVKAGFDVEYVRGQSPRLDEVPFSSDNAYMATLHHDHHGRNWVLVKGAPERVVAMADAGREWLERAHAVAARGQRVLALARGEVKDHRETLREEELPADLHVIALLGMQDPARDDAAQAIADCRRAGISVTMITGDHVATAEAVGAGLGLRVGSGGVTGPQMDALDDEQLADRLTETAIVARASPHHKLRLVRLLQARGEFVAMTGDGVNDAPALKAAEIGVAMGRRGTDVARDAADLVLVDDNFSTIQVAVREGRVVYDNIKKSLLFILPTNGGEALLIVVAVLAGITLPVTVTQVLWVNMVTAVTLALALAFEKAEPEVMSVPPRPVTEGLLTGPLVVRVAFVSGLMVIAALGIFQWEIARGTGLESARTAAVTTLVVGEVFYLFNVRHFTRSALTWSTLTENRIALLVVAVLVAAQLTFIYLPPLQAAFASESLDLLSWAMILVVCAGNFLVIEAEKSVWRRVGMPRF